jgi:16S rRNA A1518/A1519 N6-dimethyltransferase RsmA/KsgA/DIM1 with predicted DNA glycosylase/AP lyase activity
MTSQIKEIPILRGDRSTLNKPVRQVLICGVPYGISTPLSAKILKNGTLKTYKGLPHGMLTTHAETINAALLAFMRDRAAGAAPVGTAAASAR